MDALRYVVVALCSFLASAMAGAIADGLFGFNWLASAFVDNPAAFVLYSMSVLSVGVLVGVLLPNDGSPRVRWRDMDPFMLEFLLMFVERHGPLPYAAQGGGWEALRDAGIIRECHDAGYDRSQGTWWFIDERYRRKVRRRRRWMRRRIEELRGDARFSAGPPRTPTGKDR